MFKRRRPWLPAGHCPLCGAPWLLRSHANEDEFPDVRRTCSCVIAPPPMYVMPEHGYDRSYLPS